MGALQMSVKGEYDAHAQRFAGSGLLKVGILVFKVTTYQQATTHATFIA